MQGEGHIQMLLECGAKQSLGKAIAIQGKVCTMLNILQMLERGV